MTNPFSLNEIQRNEAETPDPTNDNPFSLRNIQADRGAQLRNTLKGAVQSNPDAASDAARLAKRYAVAPDVALRNVDELRQRETADNARAALAGAPALTETLIQKPFVAKQAHADITTLAGLETMIKGILDPVDPKPAPAKGGVLTNAMLRARIEKIMAANPTLDVDTARALALQGSTLDNVSTGFLEPERPKANLANLIQGIYTNAREAGVQADQGTTRFVADAIGADATAERAAAQSKASRDRQFVGVPEPESRTGRNVYGAINSVVQQAPGIAVSVATGNPAPALASIFGVTYGPNYNKYRDRGATFGEATMGATLESGLEVATEFLPMKIITDKIGKVGIKGFMQQYLGAELWTEEVNTVLSGAVDTAIANPDKTWGQYFAELPGDMLDTAVQTLVQSGILAGASRVLQTTVMAAQAQEYRNAESIAQAERLTDMLKAATEVGLREKSPEEFRAVVQSMVEQTEGAPQQMFVDAEVLAQLPGDVLAQLPGVAEQMQEALASGDVVALNMSDVLTVAPGTALEQTLVEHGRIGDPFAMSQFEAKQAGEQAQVYLQQKAAEVIQQASDQQAMQESSDRVRQGVLDQLNTTKRFRKEVNEAYATWTTAFYTTMAGHLGITPEEMAAKYPLRIVDKTGAGGVLNSKMDQTQTPEFRNWFGDSKAVEMVGGTGSKDAVFAPMRLFHTTRNGDFTAFEAGRTTVNSTTFGDVETTRAAIFFTPSVEDSNAYGKLSDGRVVKGAATIPVYLKTENPLDLTEGVKEGVAEQLAATGFVSERFVYNSMPHWEMFDGENGKAVVDAARAAGYDSIIFNDVNPITGDTFEAWAVFDPTQIKSAIGNSGAFDPGDANILNQSVSTRVPWAKPRGKTPVPIENPLSERLQVGIEAFRDVPDALDNAMALLTTYPNWRPAWRLRNTESKVERFISEVVGNLLWLHDQVPAEIRARSKLWYDGANAIAGQFAEQYGVTLAQASAVLAVNSPQTEWFTNVSRAERIFEIWSSQQDFRWSAEMEETATRILGKEQYVDDLSEIRGKTLAELAGNSTQQAMWLRVFDESHNDRAHRIVTPEGTFGDWVVNADGVTRTKTAWASFGHIAKSIEILQDGSIPNISFRLGNEHKVRSFYNNIFMPTDPVGDVTIDTHAVAAGLLRPLAGSNIEVVHNLGGGVSNALKGLSGTYGVYAEAYRRAAKERGILPREMQSITWEAVRGLYTDTFKSSVEAEQVEQAWRDFRAGRLTEAQVRDRVLELSGGVNEPNWWQSDRRPPTETWSSSYGGELSPVRVPGGAADAAASGDRAGSGERSGAGDDVAPAQGAVDGQLQQAGNGAGRYSSGGLAPLPGAPEIAGATGPDPRLVAVAEQYAAAAGIPLKRQSEYTRVDPARAARIADAYASMAHAPKDPAVQAAYADLIAQTTAQYQALQAAGYKFWFMDPGADPYRGNPWNAMRDLRANQSMAIFPTEAGFGTGGQVNIGLADPNGGANLEPQKVFDALRSVGAEVDASAVFSSDTEPTLVIKVKTALTKEQGDRLSEMLGQEAIAQRTDDDKGTLFGPMAEKWGPFNPEYFVTSSGERGDQVANPLLADTGITWGYGSPDGEQRPVLANDLFRAVHDAFGHGLEGAGFRAQGEENAWQAHARLFTGPALGALTSETRGQNSWLNYGPYGESNQNAKVEDTVFADQKTGLMPEWTWTEGRVDDVLEQPSNQTPRGTFNPKNMELALNENANLSTFLHETGHFFLEVMADLASKPDAPVQVREDMDKLLAWFGTTDAQWRTWQDEYAKTGKLPPKMVEAHERLAESLEQYVLEGKAPSTELQPVFRRLKSFMLSVYQSIKNFIAGHPEGTMKLSDDVRKVFDRMLASDEQIAQAEEVAGLLPDMDATETAKEKLTARSIRDLKWAVGARSKLIKALQAQAATTRKEVRAEVEAEVDEMPSYQAKVALDKLREATPEFKDALKDWGDRREAAKERAAEQVKEELLLANPEVKGLQKGQLLAKNKKALSNQAEAIVIGWEKANPKPIKPVPANADAQMESIAAKYGFTSVDEMLQAIDLAGTREGTIEGITDQRMLERHGDLIDQRAIEEAATAAVHNDARAKALATELSAQAEMLNPREETGKNKKGNRLTVNAIVQASKIFAANIVSRTAVRDLQSKARQHLAAEARAGKRWLEATKKADTAAAVRAKQDQVLNNAAAKAALEAKGDVEKMIDYLRKFEKDGTRKNLAVDYLDQIDKLMETIDLRASITKGQVDKRASLRKWVDSQHALGLDPILPENLLEDMRLTSYKEMTVEDLTSLVDVVKNIEHLGRLKGKLLAAKDKREFDIIATEIADEIVANGGKPLPVQLEPDGRIKKFFKGAWADHRKLNSLVHQMDGGKDNGPFYRALVRSMNDAGADENVRLEKATEALAKLYKPIEALPGGISGAKLYIPEIKNSLTRAGRLSVALNWGNAQNRQRVLSGDNWTEAQVNAILKTLSPVELEFVNNVWEHIDSYWPDVKAKQLRVSGVVEDKVEAEPFEIEVGVGAERRMIKMRGGYYPIKYDGDRSVRAERNEAKERAAEIMRGAVARPTTRRGHTKQRVDEVKGRPVKKDLSVITQHVNQVVHDLAWHEWFIDANRILNDPRILGAIRDHHGPDIHRAMTDAIEAIAVGDAVHQGQIDKLLLLMRANVTRSIMGASLTTALLQPFGLTQSMARIGVVPVLKGAGRWAGDAMRMESTVKWINEKSEFMRLRSKTFNRELREISQRVQGKGKFMQVADASLFMLMQKMQMIADVPTWVGAYEKALAGGVDDSAAVALADEAVLSSQGGGTTKDLAGVQRNMPFLTQFYSYFNTTLNLVAEKTALTDFKNPKAVAGWLGDMALLTVIPAILPALITYLLKGGDEDDPEKLAKKMLEWQASYLLGMFVGLRELPTLWSPFDYGGPPAAKLLNDGKRLVQQAGQGEIDDPAVLATIGFLGTALGIPTTQIIRSYKGWLAWDEGDAPASSILFGPPPKD